MKVVSRSEMWCEKRKGGIWGVSREEWIQEWESVFPRLWREWGWGKDERVQCKGEMRVVGEERERCVLEPLHEKEESALIHLFHSPHYPFISRYTTTFTLVTLILISSTQKNQDGEFSLFSSRQETETTDSKNLSSKSIDIKWGRSYKRWIKDSGWISVCMNSKSAKNEGGKWDG